MGLIERLRKQWGDDCVVCGTRWRRRRNRTQLEFAHVKATRLYGPGRGQKHRYLDIRRNPHAYVLMCRPCHKAFDAGQAMS